MYQSIRETGNAAAPETTTLTSVNPSAALSFFLIKDETKGIFKKIMTTPIENEKNCMSAKDLKSIAQKNHFNVDAAKNLDDAIKKISSRDKKLIICLGSLYNVGNILNKN